MRLMMKFAAERNLSNNVLWENLRCANKYLVFSPTVAGATSLQSSCHVACQSINIEHLSDQFSNSEDLVSTFLFQKSREFSTELAPMDYPSLLSFSQSSMILAPRGGGVAVLLYKERCFDVHFSETLSVPPNMERTDITTHHMPIAFELVAGELWRFFYWYGSRFYFYQNYTGERIAKLTGAQSSKTHS